MTEITFPKVGEKHRLVPLFNPGNALGGKRIKKQERAILIYSRNLEKVMGKELGFSAGIMTLISGFLCINFTQNSHTAQQLPLA